MAASAKLSGDQLTLDLERDDEEEHGHEPVVDPVPQILGHRPTAAAQGELGTPQLSVEVGERAVGPDQGDKRRGEQHDPTGRLSAQEAEYRLHDGVADAGTALTNAVLHSTSGPSPTASTVSTNDRITLH
jgi:hypothetical protein